MQSLTQAISRQALLEKANALIKEHDDYLAGMQADEVIQQGDVLVFRGPFFLMPMACRRLKPRRCLTCSNTLPWCCRRSTTWNK